MPKITARIRPERFRFRRRHLLLALAAVGAGALTGLTLHDTSRVDGRDAGQPKDAIAVRHIEQQRTVDASGPAAAVASSASWLATAKAAPGDAIPITLSASPAMVVGDMGDLVIGTHTSRPIRSISLRLRVDPNVLTLQEGSAGDWLARGSSPNPFESEISPRQDQIWIRSEAGQSLPEGESGSIAVVRLQAMAPGDAVVTVEDVRIVDDSGQAIGFVCTPSQVNVKVANPLPT